MAQKLYFVKMEGAGNDYVYVDCFSQYVPGPQAFAKRVSDRHFGIGSDGVILIKPSKRADCFMDIYNADGSRGRTCGNGLRCVAMYMWKKSGEEKRDITIETLSGICRASVDKLNSRKCWVTVDMGRAFCRDITVPKYEIGKMLPDGVFVKQTAVVDTGNLHCVVWLKCYDDHKDPRDVLALADLPGIGRFLENYRAFPVSVNVELCMEMNKEWCGHEALGITQAFGVRVWERGSGETLACGSGACAVFRGTRREDGVSEKRSCCIFMPGGRLAVRQEEEGLKLLGEAAWVFEGSIHW